MIMFPGIWMIFMCSFGVTPWRSSHSETSLVPNSCNHGMSTSIAGSVICRVPISEGAATTTILGSRNGVTSRPGQWPSQKRIATSIPPGVRSITSAVEFSISSTPGCCCWNSVIRGINQLTPKAGVMVT